MRHDRPTLRGRFAALDTRLRVPAVTRTVASLAAGLLLVQGAVVLDRTDTRPEPPEIAALEPPVDDGAVAPDATPTDEATTAAAPLVTDVATTDAGTDAGTDTDTAGTTGTTDVAEAEAGTTGQHAAAAPADQRGAAPAGEQRSGTSTDVAAPTQQTQQRSSAGSTAVSSSPGRDRFESRFPAQARAGQDTARPDTTRWAVLIGVNVHSGRTRNNIGSRQDAEDLARHLRSLGWRDDHIVLLTDGVATRENIVEALHWLRRKANDDSVVVVHYSGHVKQWPGRDVDGDGEVTDEAFWPSDNRFITDGEVGALLGRIHAARLWFNVGGCEAAGFNDWGTTGPNRIVTWSSAEHQKSYEEPSKRNSVWGWQMIEEGMIAGRADANGDGNVTVEEAFRFATPRADQRTRGQSPHGRQTPQVSDRLTGEFDLRIPPPPRPRSQPKGSDGDGPSCLLCPGATAAALRWR